MATKKIVVERRVKKTLKPATVKEQLQKCASQSVKSGRGSGWTFEIPARIVAPKKDEISGELVGTAITLKNNAVADQAQLRAWCAERIKADCVPDKWFFVAEIPKTDRGKINRDTVMQACLNKKENGT